MPKNEADRGPLFAASLLACIFLPLILYSNSFHAPFFFDDTEKIVNNPDIKNMEHLGGRLIYRPAPGESVLFKNDPSRPLTYFTFAVNYYYGNLDPVGYHLVNVGIHIVVTIFIFLLSRRVLGEGLLPLAAALLFAAHPMNTESVSYISHRSESLAAVFYLLTLLCFEKSRRAALVFFVLALFSKQTAVTLPAVLLLYDRFFLSGFKKSHHVPFWAVALAYVLFRRFYFGAVGDTVTDAYEKWTSLSYLLVQSTVILDYLKLLAVPVGQCIDHFVHPIQSAADPKLLLSFLAWIGIAAALYKAFRMKTAAAKLILFSSLWILITLSPTSSFLPIYDAMAERRVYLSGFGASILFIGFYLAIFKNKKLTIGLIGIHILLLSAATWNRNKMYQVPRTLWQEAVRLYPDSHRAHNNLGACLHAEGNYADALKEFQKSFDLNPTYAPARENLEMATNAIKTPAAAVQMEAN